MSKPIIAMGTLAATFLLAACDVRREGGEEDEPLVEVTETDESGEVMPTPTTTPSESILRQDGESIPELIEPTQPVDITLPFPDGADINDEAREMLRELLREDALDEDWPVILAGHTDSGGNDQANLRASRSRAEAVAAWLVERGVADERIEVIAFGEQNPVAPNALPDGTPNESGRRSNRRVEVRIAPPPAENDNSTDDDQGA